MAGGGPISECSGSGRRRAERYEGRVTPYVVLACLVAATGGSIFGYDLGISGIACVCGLPPPLPLPLPLCGTSVKHNYGFILPVRSDIFFNHPQHPAFTQELETINYATENPSACFNIVKITGQVKEVRERTTPTC